MIVHGQNNSQKEHGLFYMKLISEYDRDGLRLIWIFYSKPPKLAARLSLSVPVDCCDLWWQYPGLGNLQVSPTSLVGNLHVTSNRTEIGGEPGPSFAYLLVHYQAGCDEYSSLLTTEHHAKHRQVQHYLNIMSHYVYTGPGCAQSHCYYNKNP